MEPGPLTAERIFESLFRPLYPPDAQADLARARSTDANPAGNPAIVAQLDAIADSFARVAPTAFDGADLVLDRSDASVHRLGAALTRERRDRWLTEKGPDGLPLLVHVAIHGAVYLAACAVASHGARWQVRQPLWESLVRLVSRAGEGDLALFHWWLKSLSDEEIGRATLAERWRQHVEVPCTDPSGWPRIAPGDRRLPRIAKGVRYDVLHRHLKAHLPELSDLGVDFPAPDRFAAMRFRWLDFALLGDGRTLLMYGPAEGGAHLFWLDARGFVKGAFWPADAGTDPEVAVDGDKLRVRVTVLGKTVDQEMLWWGP